MRANRAPTLQDVAREVGVSAMTASVVLNGARSATRVSDATRTRIFDAAERLRYRPNAVARGLSRRRMNALGVVAVVDGAELNLYFLELLNGILEGAAQHHQIATVYSIDPGSDILHEAHRFCDGRVDGLIFVAPRFDDAAAEALRHRHTPFVTVHGTQRHADIWNVDVDNEGGAYAAVQHLLRLGHRRILHFPGQEGTSDSGQRLAGYRRALADARIPFDDALVVPGNYSAWSGRKRMAETLTAFPAAASTPTAVFCGSDAIAAGVLEVLSENGVRVPEDFSVVGFDDSLLARMTTPSLTTVRQPFRQLGRAAVDLLLPLIGGTYHHEGAAAEDPPPAARTTVFDVELVVRGSAGPPPGESPLPP